MTYGSIRKLTCLKMMSHKVKYKSDCFPMEALGTAPPKKALAHPQPKEEKRLLTVAIQLHAKFEFFDFV